MDRPGPAVFFLAAAPVLLTACSSFPHRLAHGRIESAAMGREMAYAVYTPPGWTPAERLPLVLFLHGGGDSEDCFDRAYVGQGLDAAITAGEAPRVIVCVPDGERGFWENWFDGSHRYRDWVMDDLLPHVRRQYQTLAGRENLHLMGISMGGHGTLRFAHLEGAEFESVAAISAPVMNADQLVAFTDNFWLRLFVPMERIWGPTDDLERIRKDDLFAQWRSQQDLGGLRLMLVHGTEDRDGIIQGMGDFHRHLRRHGVEHGYLVYEGRHRWVDWRPVLPAVLRFLVQQQDR